MLHGTAELFGKKKYLGRRYIGCAGAVPCGNPIAHWQSHGPTFYMIFVVKGHRRRLVFLLGWSISSRAFLHFSTTSTSPYNQL